jgi:hypothetical protein
MSVNTKRYCHFQQLILKLESFKLLIIGLWGRKSAFAQEITTRLVDALFK